MLFSPRAEEAADPGLAQFSKMVKCLSQHQAGQLGNSLSGPEWNQFNTMPGMQFVPNWNYNQQNKNAGQGNRHRSQPYPGSSWQQQGGGQPRPGVHQSDWGRGRGGQPGGVGGPQQQWPQQPVGPRQGPGVGMKPGGGIVQGPQQPQGPYDRVNPTVWGKTKDREDDDNER